MANVDRPFGLRPVAHLKGGSWNGKTQLCYIPSTASIPAFIGDAVVRAGTANATGVYPTMVIATAGATNPIYGVITSFELDASYLGYVHQADDTSRFCHVCCDPDVIFEIQDDGAAVLGIASVGLNANLIYTHAGNAITGYSGTELDTAGTTADATAQLLILGAAPYPDNDATLAHTVWRVLISQHQLRNLGGGGMLGS